MCRTDRTLPSEDSVGRHLRQRFMVWGVAIASSLSTSGLVNLRPSAAWAQEEPAAAPDETAQEQTGLSREAFNELLRDRDYAKAGELLDAAIQAEPDNSDYTAMNLSLAMNMMRTDASGGLARLRQQYQRLLAKDTLDIASASLLASTANYVTNYDRDASTADKIQVIDEALAKIRAADEQVPASMSTALISSKVRLLVSDGKAEAAKQLLDEQVAVARGEVDVASVGTVQQFLGLASTYGSALANDFPEAVEQLQAEAEALALKLLDKEDAGVSEFLPYYNLKAGIASRLTYTDPKQALAVVGDIEQRLEALKEGMEEAEAAKLARYESSLKSTRSRIETAVAREELIGTTAPELDAAHFVAMAPTSMGDLKGKVVLIDFWAVWCGPCIATFPHLIEWHEKYADQGLEIIGVTNFYGYTWNEDAGRAMRGEEVSEEDELAMLDKFRDAYDLQHGFVVTPKGSEYAKTLMVSGIPQAVLIDKEGKIRMIRVGSGEANAKALEGMIEELLAR